MSANDFEERVVTVPLRDVTAVPTDDRAARAMSIIRDHLATHFSVDAAAVRLDPAINEVIHERGVGNPPRKLRIRAARFDEAGEAVVEAEPAE